MVHIDSLVSQTTLDKFNIYERLLREWNRKTSLVQEDTLKDFYTRHILDSIQTIPIINGDIFSLLKASVTPISPYFRKGMALDQIPGSSANLNIIDVGTGAGFPGLVLAMCGFKNVTLCESNQKKCIFLEEVARETNTSVIIANDRVENLQGHYDIILSRAVSDLISLCSLVVRLSRSDTSFGLFHKGRSWQIEVDLARKEWNFDLTAFESITSKDSVILHLLNLQSK